MKKLHKITTQLKSPFIVLPPLLLIGITSTIAIAQNSLKAVVEYKQVNQKIKIQGGSKYRKRGKAMIDGKTLKRLWRLILSTV